MAETKSLIKDSVIYGGTNILSKMSNWLITTLLTYYLTKADFGLMNNLYAYIALIIVILTFGMETGLFRFLNKKGENPGTVYSTALTIVGSFVLVFLVGMMFFLPSVRSFIWQDSAPDSYIRLVILILSMDAFNSIPFAYLRYKKRPIKFGALKLLYVIIYALFCAFFLVVCPKINEYNPDLIGWFWRDNFGVGYVLVANLIATAVQTIALLPELGGFKYRFDWRLAKQMLHYSAPLVILGIMGMANQVIDKIVFPWVYPDPEMAMDQLGVYSACFKIAQIMMMFTQAFRYAYDPFIFEKSREEGAQQAYADVMKYFVLFGLVIFLGVTFYLDIIKYFIGPEHRVGLKIVPIVLIGELFFAIYYNLSIWYKITDKTHWGAIFSCIGFVVILGINIIFIPRISYMACAWASFIGNGLIMLLSYFIGQKHYPIRYDLKTIGLYTVMAVSFYAVSQLIPIANEYLHMLFNTVLLFLFLTVMVKRDIPLKSIPFINKRHKR